MISKEVWARIIKDFQERDLPEIIPREAAIPFEIPIKRSISIVGPRRAGKTFEMFYIIQLLLKKYEKNQILYVNFEDIELEGASHEDLKTMLETFYELFPENINRRLWLFLDEIQNIEKWEKFVRNCLDRSINVFLSGSSSKLLSKEIATSMRGRNLTYNILPFSFREYLRARGIEFEEYLSSKDKAILMRNLTNYMEFGGYPEAILYEKEREKILKDILETAIYRDVVERIRARNIRVLKLLLSALINSKEFSVNKFYNFLKSQGIRTSKNVLYKYLDALNDAFIVFPLRKFDFSHKRVEQSIPKIYFVDNGLLRINGITDKGRLMENLVFVELLRSEKNIYYYKDTRNREVDFVIKKDRAIEQLIQVCYDLGDYTTREREVKSLIKASDVLRCKDMLIITWDDEDEIEIKREKIKCVPLWKWLLSI